MKQFKKNQMWLALAIALGSFNIAAQASSNGLVISQVYGGGGNASAPLKNDYIEIFNASASTINLSGYSIQYASAAGTGNFTATTLPNITLSPGQYFLVQQASGGAIGSSLPTPDASGSINMSATAGKVALVNSTTGLTCNGGSTPCSAVDLAKIVDMVGFGTTANFYEGSASVAGSNTLALIRANSGCQDQNNNNLDFAAGIPAPRNTASPIHSCGSVINQPVVASCPAKLEMTVGESGLATLSAMDIDGQVSQVIISSPAINGISLTNMTLASAIGSSAKVDLTISNSLPVGSYPVTVNFANNDAQSASCVVNVNISAATPVTPIYDIQGSGNASPLTGNLVVTEGIVTAVFPGLNGFYLQDDTGDGSPFTSDGVFVYGITAGLNVGDKIRLKGTVTEFNTVTELNNPNNLSVLSTNNNVSPLDISLPEAVDGDMERYEGMLVRIISPLTVSQNYFQGRYGQVTLSSDGRMIKPTNIYRPGSVEALNLADENARRRIILDDGSSAQNPNTIPYVGLDSTLRAGDTLISVTGVIDYGLITASATGPRDYKINPTEVPVFARDNPRTMAPASVGGNIKIASANVLNYFTTFTNGQTVDGLTGQGCSLGTSVLASNCRGADNLAEFIRQRNKVINEIVAINADAVGLMEIQNNGATAVQNLVDGLNAKLGANTYSRIADPANGTGTDAIKVALIYKPAKLSPSGLALSDNNSVNNRPTLAQTFAAANGEKFSVIVNHFKSKSCSNATGLNADQNDGQGCYNPNRIDQATQLIQNFLPQVKVNAADDDILLIGDFNAYGKEDPIDYLTSNGISDQIVRFNGQQGYSYVFDGESGYIDHALANASMTSQITGALEWHINADEPSVIDYNIEFKPQDLYTSAPFRASDHDPIVIGLNLQKKISGTIGRDSLTGTTGDDSLYGGKGADTLTGGAGADIFVYTNLQDGIDTITDFQSGKDRIDLVQLLQALGISNNNPIAEGYISCSNSGSNALMGIDADGIAGTASSRTLIQIKNTTCNTLMQNSNFNL